MLAGKLLVSDVGDSSTEPGNPIAHATDGLAATRWISQPSSPANITSDLGGVYDLSRIVIVFAADTVRNYTVSTSMDGSAYTQVASGTTNNTPTQTVTVTNLSAAPKARYIRITCVDRWNAAYGNSLWEVEAYGMLDVSHPVGSITNFAATAVSGTQISLSWAYSGSALASYTLRRGGTTIASPTPSTTTYSDTGLTAGTNYTYTLTGTYQAGGTTNTASVSRSTPGGGGILKLMPLGDSITEGAIWSTNTWQGGYRKVLLDRLTAQYPGRVDFVGSLTAYSSGMSDPQHEGHSGWQTSGINSNVATWISTYQPDIVLLHIGTNDLAQSVAVPTITENLNQIIAKIYGARPGCTIILCTLVPMLLGGEWNFPRWVQYNSSVRSLATTYASQGRAIILADMATEAGLVAGRPDDMGDGWHPSDSGYTKMANYFMTKLAPLL